MFKSFLLNSTSLRAPDDEKGQRDAAIAAERAKVQVTSVKIEDEDKEEAKNDEQKEEDGEKETKDDGEENKAEDESDTDKEDDVKDEDKEELKLAKKNERLEKKYNRTADKLKEKEKRIRELEAKLAADPEKKLTEEDVETLAEAKANRKQMEKELNATSDKLADAAQKQLKLKDKEFKNLVAETLEELNAEYFPGEIVGALGDLDNGGIVLAHLLKNPDEMEEIFALKARPVKLGMELTKLSTKLLTPKVKKISQVPDAIEPLGGKAGASDRLEFLFAKKNKTQAEMDELIQARNAQVAERRAGGRRNLR